jgi:hypothetical protein
VPKLFSEEEEESIELGRDFSSPQAWNCGADSSTSKASMLFQMSGDIVL